MRLYELYIRFMVWLGAAPPPEYEQLVPLRKNRNDEFEKEERSGIGTTVVPLILELFFGVTSGLLFGAIFGGIFLTSVSIFFQMREGQDFQDVLSINYPLLMIGACFGLGPGFVGGLIGTALSNVVDKDVAERAIIGGGIGGTVVALVGVGLYILTGIVD